MQTTNDLLPDAVVEGPIRPPSRLMERLARYLELGALLRLAGAGLVVAGVVVFLLQRWQDGNDLFRYGLLLGQTALLTALGFATNRWLAEPKSARLFLGLGLVSAAASFTILGALIYSIAPLDRTVADYPGFAAWQLGSAGPLWTLAPATGALLLAVAAIGFRVLARERFKLLTTLFFANGSLLLIPARDPAIAAALALAAGVAGMFLLGRWSRESRSLATPEGVAARILAMSPLLILAVRTGLLYNAGAVSAASLALLIYFVFRQSALLVHERSRLRNLLEWPAALAVIGTGLAVTAISEDLVRYAWDTEAMLLAMSLVSWAGFLDLARISARNRKRFHRLAVVLPLLSALLALLQNTEFSRALLLILVCAVGAWIAHRGGLPKSLRASVVGLVAGGVALVVEGIDAADLGGWLGLALFGIAVIILAAAVERHGERIKALLWSRTPPSEVEPS